MQKFNLFLEIYCDSFWESIVDFVMLSIKYFINSIFFLLQRFFVVEDIILHTTKELVTRYVQ